MTHMLYVWREKAYDGEIALARKGHLLNSAGARKTNTLEFKPKLVYRVRHDDAEELVTDPVEVYHLTHKYPQSTVDILPVVA